MTHIAAMPLSGLTPCRVLIAVLLSLLASTGSADSSVEYSPAVYKPVLGKGWMQPTMQIHGLVSVDTPVFRLIYGNVHLIMARSTNTLARWIAGLTESPSQTLSQPLGSGGSL